MAGHVTDLAVTWAGDQQYEELLAAAADAADAAAAEAGADARIEEVGEEADIAGDGLDHIGLTTSV